MFLPGAACLAPRADPGAPDVRIRSTERFLLIAYCALGVSGGDDRWRHGRVSPVPAGGGRVAPNGDIALPVRAGAAAQSLGIPIEVVR
jgi:hypothetical protein